MANLIYDEFWGPVILVDGVGYRYYREVPAAALPAAQIFPPEAVFATAYDFQHPCEIADCTGSFMQGGFNVLLSDYGNNKDYAKAAVDVLMTEWLVNGGDPGDPVCANPIECGRVYGTLWAGRFTGYLCYTCPTSSVETSSSESSSRAALYTLCPSVPIISSSSESSSSSYGPPAWTGAPLGAPWLQLKQAIAGLTTGPKTFTISWSIMKEGNLVRYRTPVEGNQPRQEERRALELREHGNQPPGVAPVTAEQFEAEIESAMEMWKAMFESVFSVANGYDNPLTVEIVNKHTESGITTPSNGWPERRETIIKGGGLDDWQWNENPEGEVQDGIDRWFSYPLHDPAVYGYGPYDDPTGTSTDNVIARQEKGIDAYNDGVGDIRICGIQAHRRANHADAGMFALANTYPPGNSIQVAAEQDFYDAIGNPPVPAGRAGWPLPPPAAGKQGTVGGDCRIDVVGHNWRMDGTPEEDVRNVGNRLLPGISIKLVVLHELGHAFGIGHDTDTDSLMYETIPRPGDTVAQAAAKDIEDYFPAAAGGFTASAPDRRSLEEIYGVGKHPQVFVS